MPAGSVARSSAGAAVLSRSSVVAIRLPWPSMLCLAQGITITLDVAGRCPMVDNRLVVAALVGEWRRVTGK